MDVTSLETKEKNCRYMFKNLYYDINDLNNYVHLSRSRIIEAHDIHRGSIIKEELMLHYSSLVDETKLGPNSFLIERDALEDKETIRLPIK